MISLIGIAAGFAAACSQSMSYLFSRSFVKREARGAIVLLVASHMWMALMALAVLPFVWGFEGIDLRSLAVPISGAAGFYLIGQLVLFMSLRRIVASRVSPLLGLKVVILALLCVALLGKDLSWTQWLAVGLCLVAAFLLNEVGGRIPAAVLFGILGTVTAYALSDLYIQRMVTILNPLGPRGPVLGVCLEYIFGGIATSVFLVWFRPKSARAWRSALPYALFWFLGMCFFYVAIALIGVLFSVIIQSTRGIISIWLGTLISGRGFVHLETPISRRLFWKRIIAAAMMAGAISLYAIGG